MLIFILFISLFHSFAQDSISRAQIQTPLLSTEKPIFEFSLTSSIHRPLFHRYRSWHSFAAGGVDVHLPTTQPHLITYWGLECGYLDQHDSPFDREFIKARLAAAYDFTIQKISPRLKMSVRPFAGIAFFTVNLSQEHVDYAKLIEFFFDHFESEFGILAGIEPIITIGTLFISMPISSTVILSSPKRFMTATVSLCAGVIL
ncbi:MAG: hypothetical protein JW795_21255 [Chitinivibrionales bacterium]|nr:hypothetical protein [Chitinivibrionales bacterium]